VLADSKVEDVSIVGRRGPAQARFTTKELRELGEIPGVDVIVRPEDLELDPLTAEQQAARAHAAEHPVGYQVARVTPTPFKGLPGAQLEFGYAEAEPWHALELAVRTPGYLLTMAIYSRDRDWPQGWVLFQAFAASLQPPPA
jgi:hypothetical protein